MNSTYFRPQPELFGLRVVKYIRCSHDGQVLHGDTLEAQDALLDEFIKVNRMVLVDTFIDEALTARKKFTRRKEFVRLLDGVRSHSFDMILFTKLDRWFRNIGDYHKIQEVLEANGVQWKAITESYDTTTTNGRLHINIRLSVAQDECDRDSDRIKDVFAYKLKNKTYLSGSLPRGLKLDDEKHVIIDPEWKQFALDMFDHFEQTNSKRGTLLYLKEKYGIYLCYDTISRNLRNSLYKGMYRDDPDFCEPLIEPERFDRIQVLGKRNVRQRYSNRTYIFTGLLICSSCNHYLVGQTTHRTLSDGTEKHYPSYRCNQRYQSHSCDRNRSYREDYVEEYLLQHIRPALSEYVAEYEVTGTNPARKNPAAEAAKIRTKMQKLYELYMDDLIDRDTYKRDYSAFQEKLKELDSIVVAPSRDLADLKKLLEQDYEEIYRTFSPQEKNAFWKSFVQSITVHEDGEMDIVFL